MNTIQTTIQGLTPGADVVLYSVDMREIGGDLQRFHGYPLQGPIWWQGNKFIPWSVEAKGFALTGNGPPPTPSLRLGNIGTDQYGLPVTGIISALCAALQDLVGAVVTRHHTFAHFLDAENFPDGNPNANPEQEFLPDIWLIGAKTFSNPQYVEFELRSAIDFEGRKLPSRQILTRCDVRYRGPRCGYTGSAMFDENGNPTTNPENDRCGKGVTDCKLRFGEFNELPHGGYPSADALRGY